MNKVPKFVFLGILLLMMVTPVQVNAENKLNDREEVLQFLEAAFHAQVSLSEQERSLAQVNEVLNPFFSKSFKNHFIEANVVEENGKYITYGSDFAPYYIPFFEFSDTTKVVFLQDNIYIIEHFPEKGDGPVSYDSHFEGIELVKEDGDWKVNEILQDRIPEDILKKAYPSIPDQKPVEKQTVSQDSLFAPVSVPVINLWKNSVSSILGYGGAPLETSQSLLNFNTVPFNNNLTLE